VFVGGGGFELLFVRCVDGWVGGEAVEKFVQLCEFDFEVVDVGVKRILLPCGELVFVVGYEAEKMLYR